MPRFVLLRHECSPRLEKPSHWDFMLESQGVLRTWDIRHLPTAWAAYLGEHSDLEAVTAHALPDHRLDYLDYEGPLSNDRGTVRCGDRGVYQFVQQAENSLTVAIQGDLLQGDVRLIQRGQNWSLEPINMPVT